MHSYHADSFQQSRQVRVAAPPTRWNRKAVVAAAVSPVAWIVPLLPAAVVVLAVSALASVRRSPGSKFRGGVLAGAALGLGLLGAVGQGYLGVQAFAVYQQLRSGPTAALASGLGGDVPAFLDAFEAAPQPDQAEAFLEELDARYGPLVHASPPSSAQLLTALRAQPVTQRYRLQFERGIVWAEATMRPPLADGPGWPAPPRVVALTVTDPARGTVAFPETRLSEVAP